MYSSEEETIDIRGKAFESHLKKKAEEEKKVTNEKNETSTKGETSKKGKQATKVEKKEKAKGGKDWTEDEISLLIDMFEDKPCLWDVFDKHYTKRDVKEIAYKEIADSLDTNIESIKTKINGLRAQLGREVAKVNKTKSGQSTDDLYNSSWIHYDRLSFLLPVIKSSKSQDTLKRKNDNDEENGEVEEMRHSTPLPKKKTIAERKLELLSKCTEAITKPVESRLDESRKHSAFAIYIDERLSKLDVRERRIAEKRISDVLFEVEMQNEREDPANRQLTYGTYYRNVGVTQPVQGQSYMEMLNNPRMGEY